MAENSKHPTIDELRASRSRLLREADEAECDALDARFQSLMYFTNAQKMRNRVVRTEMELKARDEKNEGGDSTTEAWAECHSWRESIEENLRTGDKKESLVQELYKRIAELGEESRKVDEEIQRKLGKKSD